MTHSDRHISRLLLLGALVAALGLGACGRKGRLEPAPAAAGEQAVPAQVNAAPLDEDGLPVFNNAPVAPQGTKSAAKRRIILDPLLD